MWPYISIFAANEFVLLVVTDFDSQRFDAQGALFYLNKYIGDTCEG
jgi:hypothetical protein